MLRLLALKVMFGLDSKNFHPFAYSKWIQRGVEGFILTAKPTDLEKQEPQTHIAKHTHVNFHCQDYVGGFSNNLLYLVFWNSTILYWSRTPSIGIGKLVTLYAFHVYCMQNIKRLYHQHFL
ncbi:hypothetical protein ACJX0J_009011 [Zea mays]